VEYSLRISEESFVRNDTLKSATLPEILLLLYNVTEILLPASFNQVCVNSITSPFSFTDCNQLLFTLMVEIILFIGNLDNNYSAFLFNSMIICVSLVQVLGSVGRLHAVTMETGTRDPEIGGVELSNVEVCQCPEGYEVELFIH